MWFCLIVDHILCDTHCNNEVFGIWKISVCLVFLSVNENMHFRKNHDYKRHNVQSVLKNINLNQVIVAIFQIKIFYLQKIRYYLSRQTCTHYNG